MQITLYNQISELQALFPNSTLTDYEVTARIDSGPLQQITCFNIENSPAPLRMVLYIDDILYEMPLDKPFSLSLARSLLKFAITKEPADISLSYLLLLKKQNENI